MKREEIVVSPEALARQREIARALRAQLAQTLGHTPAAYVDTFGCPLV